MRKFFMALAAVLLLLLAGVCLADDVSYSDDLPEYIVLTENKTRGNYILYMYAEPNAQGHALVEYVNGDVLKMIQLDVNGKDTYSYVIGPDGTKGYVLTRRIVATGVKDSMHYADYPKYVVTSVARDYMYLYAEASTANDAVTHYNNGTIVSVVNTTMDTKNHEFWVVIGPDGNVGYLSSKGLTSYEDYIKGLTPTPRVTATPTPTPKATATATPWWYPTATPTPTARPTATPTARTFFNSTGYQLVLTKYNSSTNVYTTVNGTTAYMSDLGVNESYRVRLHVTSIVGTSLTYTVSANLNGTTYSWTPYTLGAYKSVYHNLGTSLKTGSNTIVMYINGITLCSGRYNIVDDTGSGSSSGGNIYGTLYGHWLRVNGSTTDDLVLMLDGTAYWNGVSCTWSCSGSTLSTTTYWGTQTYTFTLSGNTLYLTNSSMSLYNAAYTWVDSDTALIGKWTDASGSSTATFEAGGLLTRGNVSYSWAAYDGKLYLSSLWGSEQHPYVINGSTLILYSATDNTKIESVYIKNN